MKIAFLTESNFYGKYPRNFENSRTEIAWQIALDAFHYTFSHINEIVGHDHVFIIFPKGDVYLNSIGVRIANGKNRVSGLLKSNFIEILKSKNKKVHLIQEGPHWFHTDYEVEDQILFYNMLSKFDSIFAHNEYDTKYYKGLFPSITVHTIQSLMIEDTLVGNTTTKEQKTIIGGNFSRWYGGFESYLVAQTFGLPVWAQTSHSRRENEDEIENINHLERLSWKSWMAALSSFSYAVHLMPTVAAGTFALNCAYYGIPCIGNINVDTQRTCHPDLSVDVGDIESAKRLTSRLKTDSEFASKCQDTAWKGYLEHYHVDVWTKNMAEKLNLA
jgi:hypothetical protein